MSLIRIIWNRMKGIGNILIGIAVALLPVFFSCEKEVPVKNAAETLLSLNAVIDVPGLQIDTKGNYYDGNTFKDNDSIGLVILAEGSDTVEFQTGYGNIKATYSSKQWIFSIGGKDTSALVLTARSDNKRAVVYAYAPYVSGDPRNITIRTSDDIAYMYAKESGGIVIDPAVTSDTTVTLSFNHMLSRLRFKLRLENSGSDQKWDYVDIKRNSTGSTNLFSEGTYNALSMTLTGTTKTDSLRVSCGSRTLTTAADSCEMLLIPCSPYDGGSYSVVFGIDGVAYEHVISLNDVLHTVSGSAYQPFQPGYMYTFDFTLDNYVHFKGLVSGGWSTGAGFGYTVNL